MNILVVSNNPIEEYQNLCVKIIKRYCFIYNFDFIFINDYKYDEKYSHIIYIDNSNLILKLQFDIVNYIKDEYDLIYLHTYNNINKFIIMKNNKFYNFINDVNILKKEIDINKVFIIDKIISIDENTGYFQNDSLDNNIFLEKLKQSSTFFFILSLNIITEIKNHIYYQIFNKFYIIKNF